MERKQDRRINKTKKAIRNSFVKLLAEKDIEKITIKEVADGADVDRKTVYNYYGGVYEVLGDLQSELATTIEKEIDAFDFETRDIQDVFLVLTRIVKENMELYSLVMGINKNSVFITQLVEYLKEKIAIIIERRNHQADAKKIAFAAEYVTAGMFMAYRSWFHSEHSQSLEEFTYGISQLVLGGLNAFLQDK